MIGNESLGNAVKAKKDEFYTLLTDIEKELRYYKKHFENKVVFCNCDDPFESNFFKYFVLNFNRLKLKKLICTCHSTSPVLGQQLSLFDVIGGSEKNKSKPYKAVVTKVYDVTGDGSINMFDVAELFKSGENELSELKGNGDFRSEECIELLKSADIVVTNPPFSLFREYVAQLMNYQKKFLIIGNIGAFTYKETFPLLMNNQMWIGISIHSGDRAFFVPDNYPLDAAGCGIDEETGRKFIRVKGVRWFTNLDIKQRHEEMILIKKYTPVEYPKYDNYDAIEVSQTSDIPFDYSGIMAVPITFLDRYCPDQFKILGVTQSWDASRCKVYPKQKQISKKGVETLVTKLNDGPAMEIFEKPINKTYYIVDDKMYIKNYARILIRNKHPEQPKEN